jgi:hypothetical protein
VKYRPFFFVLFVSLSLSILSAVLHDKWYHLYDITLCTADGKFPSEERDGGSETSSGEKKRAKNPSFFYVSLSTSNPPQKELCG